MENLIPPYSTDSALVDSSRYTENGDTLPDVAPTHGRDLSQRGRGGLNYVSYKYNNVSVHR